MSLKKLGTFYILQQEVNSANKINQPCPLLSIFTKFKNNCFEVTKDWPDEME